MTKENRFRVVCQDHGTLGLYRRLADAMGNWASPWRHPGCKSEKPFEIKDDEARPGEQNLWRRGKDGWEGMEFVRDQDGLKSFTVSWQDGAILQAVRGIDWTLVKNQKAELESLMRSDRLAPSDEEAIEILFSLLDSICNAAGEKSLPSHSACVPENDIGIAPFHLIDAIRPKMALQFKVMQSGETHAFVDPALGPVNRFDAAAWLRGFIAARSDE